MKIVHHGSRGVRVPVLAALVPVLALGAFGGALDGTAAAADAVKLRSGDVLEGSVDDLGDRIRVRSGSRDVSLRWKDVEVVLPGKTAAEVSADLYGARRRALADTDAPALYALALWAARSGLAQESQACLDAVLKADPEHAGARAALAQQKSNGAWLEGDALLRAKGFVAQDGAWMLAEEAAMRSRQAAARREMSVDERKVDGLLAQAGKGPPAARKFAVDALGTVPAAALFRPAMRALRGGESGSRIAAAKTLVRLKDDADVLRPLLRSAVMDRDAEVRIAAAGALRDIGDPEVVKPLAKAMWSGQPEVRANAAEALGEIGGAASVEWLITRVSSSGGPGARNHIFIGSQITYVSDFDVEIAQAAQIGDPIVQTIREGAMLDFRVLNVREEYTLLEQRVAYTALRKATGHSMADDPKAWKSWFEREGREELTAKN